MSDENKEEKAEKTKMVMDLFFKNIESIINAQIEGGHTSLESLSLPLSPDYYLCNLNNAYGKLAAETRQLLNDLEDDVEAIRFSLLSDDDENVETRSRITSFLELIDAIESKSANSIEANQEKQKWRDLIIHTFDENVLDTPLPEDLENLTLNFFKSSTNPFFKYLDPSDSDDKPTSLTTELTSPLESSFADNATAVPSTSTCTSGPKIPDSYDQAVPSTSGISPSSHSRHVEELSPIASTSGTVKRRDSKPARSRRDNSDNSSDESSVEKTHKSRKPRSSSMDSLKVDVESSCDDLSDVDFHDDKEETESSDSESNRLDIAAGGIPLEETRHRSRRVEDLSSYDSNELLLQLVLTKADLMSPITIKPRIWKPPFVTECMASYEGLQVDLTFLACSLKTQLTYSYDQCYAKVDNQVLAELKKYMIIDHCFEYDAFLELIKQESEFRPHGGLTSKFSHDRVNNYEVYLCKLNDPQFQEYHRRMASFEPFFFPQAISISSQKEYFAFTIYKIETIDRKMYYRFAGYALCYKHPIKDKFKLRLRKILVLPIYRKKGVGKHLIFSIYKYFIGKEDILEISADYESEIINFLMSAVELECALELSCCSRTNVKQGITLAMMEQLTGHLHLPRSKAVRIYELTRLYWIKRGDAEDEDVYNREVNERIRYTYTEGLFDDYFKAIQDDLNVTEVNQTNVDVILEIAFHKFLAAREPVVHHVIASDVHREFMTFNVENLDLV